MNKRLLELLSDRCKDYGLTTKAIEELATLASEGIDDKTSDEDIQKRVDSYAAIAKAMQGEITRKAQANKKTTVQKSQGKGEEDQKSQDDDEVPAWFKAEMAKRDETIESLKTENEQYRAQQAKAKRTELIATKAKELGIPDFLMKHVSLADDADIEKELTEYKQELVNNKLMSASETFQESTADAKIAEDAKAWAEALKLY